MRVPYSWLKSYVDVDLQPEELGEKLTMAGLAVDSIERMGADITNVVVGLVKELKRHPEAEHLWVVHVDTGEGKLRQVITGAKNLTPGVRVPVALPGATLPGGEKIAETRFRGMVSEGMLCSAQELGLAEDRAEEEAGILILEGEPPLGVDIRTVVGLGEVVFNLDVTPNRPDCLSIIGVAREVAALTGGKLKLPPVDVKEYGENINERLKIRVDAPDLCLRYAARVLKNIRVAPSPGWLQRRLLAAGMRPINNIVDVTNYVMLETGQPLHAFDYTRLAGHEIIVRRAWPGENLITLDGVERKLSPEMLVIADREHATGLAGIMGGLLSEITDETRTVMLESACFYNISIRRTARQLGIRSEASLRFEKGVDPNGVLFALERACHLIEELGAGEVVEGIIDIYPNPVSPWEVKISPTRIRNLIGAAVSDDFIRSSLERLGLEIVGDEENSLTVRVPTFRPDLRQEADFVEEVARIYGFTEIPATAMEGVLSLGHKPHALQIEDKVKEILRAAGLDETQTYSFVHPGGVDKLRLAPDDPRRRLIRLLLPLSEEQSVLRTTLLPSLLEVAALNQRRKTGPVNIFEVNRVYWPKELPLKELPEMPRHVGIVLAGPRSESSWQGKAPDNDFYRLKGILETLLAALRVKGEFVAAALPTYHPGRQAALSVAGEEVATLGELHPAVAEAFGLSGRVYALELNLERLIPQINLAPRYRPWPRFPGVERDLAFLVPADTPAKSVTAVLEEAGGPVLSEIKLFDLYSGEQVPPGYKSLAYSFVFRAPDHTLTEEEIEPVLAAIIKAAEEQLGARVRR